MSSEPEDAERIKERITEEMFVQADNEYHTLMDDPRYKEKNRQPNGTIEYYHKQAHYFHGDLYKGKKGLEKIHLLRAIGFINIARNMYKDRLGIPREQT